jgi:hypothetical protein
MPTSRLFYWSLTLLCLALATGCSLVPDMPGPIGIPGI